MWLDLVHEKLSWPSREQVLNPTGSGPNVYARLAREKLGKAINRFQSDANAQVGVLAANPQSDATEAPLAIVCEFQNKVSPDTLKETHRLAWSFCRSPLLLTLEPYLLRAWTCCEPPAQSDSSGPFGAELPDAKLDLQSELSVSQRAAQALHWVQLASGQFFRKHENRFQRKWCADQTLLDNLDFVRQKLQGRELDDDIIHDLLARVIFIQYLFHRKDSSGKSALNADFLSGLRENKIISADYRDLHGILQNYDDTYAFFRWLNDKFNGDLFPGKGDTAEEREAEWQAEMEKVKPPHLDLLAEFVSGEIEMKKGQKCLWPYYSFDAIPLEFISSIYEKFVKGKRGAYYTPGHLVDFLLDSVLPWDSEEWDVKILDPACGSGIFLVKAFQRLIHRWKNASPDKEPRAALLKQLLERNLFGIDIDPHAVRVASFSLYLAMCDEIDPRFYWQQVRFPRLRDRRLINADFFQEDRDGFRTLEDNATYHLVIGNAPWGQNTTTDLAEKWGKVHDWSISYNDIGTLFLAKAAKLAQSNGQVAMLQPSGTLLFNQISTARDFRKKLFTTCKVEEIVNLSALRFGLFWKSVSPSCIVTLQPTSPDNEPVSYICPKPLRTNESDFRIVIEPHDVNAVYPHEAATDSYVWAALMWGGRRDFLFIRRLSQKPTLAKLTDKYSEGIIRGNRKQRDETILGRRILEGDQFPKGTFLRLKAEQLPINHDPYVERSRKRKRVAFELPQLLIKQSWKAEDGRFRAAIIESDTTTGGVLSSQSYVSVHVSNEFYPYLEAACLSYNSKIAVYYFLLTSGRLAFYRPELRAQELLKVPFPEPRSGLLDDLATFDNVDLRLREVFSFKDTEWVLIDDLVQYTLPDFKGDQSSPGRQKTRRSTDNDEPDLRKYCEYFLRVLKAGFGQDKRIGATIFQEFNALHLPVRLIGIHFDSPNRAGINIESIDSPELLERLQELNQKFLKRSGPETGGIFYQRVVRMYDTFEAVPTVYLIKPDQIRYWTRSMALRDADEVAADIMLWQQKSDKDVDVVQEELRA
jgi:hypothetical protein